MEETLNNGLTKDENEVLRLTGELTKAYFNCERNHPNESQEFIYAIHLIQGLLTMRIARREYPDAWPTFYFSPITKKWEKKMVTKNDSIVS